ncbi:MAG TPA: FkbM family methyltransferase [Opitutaceae bacterium]|jgi:FkbM family methyltransferase
MSFLLKKIRLAGFLARRVPALGLRQCVRGFRERRMSYLAMELAEVLPGGIATIVDVGAHAGLVSEALDFLYQPSRIWVVEPNPAHGPSLEGRFSGRPQFRVVRSCLGERSADVAFNVHDFDAASSLYACRAGHLASFGFEEGRTAITVPMTTLSEMLSGEPGAIDLLKLDCQGAELSVLKGAGGRLRDVRWVYCEVSIDPIYEGAPLWGEVHEFLRASGFELRKVGEFAGAGKSIQWADALYANSSRT